MHGKVIVIAEQAVIFDAIAEVKPSKAAFDFALKPPSRAGNGGSVYSQLARKFCLGLGRELLPKTDGDGLVVVGKIIDVPESYRGPIVSGRAIPFV